MASFIARVELHDARSLDYETLHREMAGEGFSRTITGDKGVYELPTAEYDINGQYSRADILDKADRAATKTLKRHGILVTEFAGCAWRGLKQVRAAQRV